MKKVFLFAAVAALFAACSSKDEVVKDDSTLQPQLEKGAIGFDVYTQKASTRAGWAGSLTTADLKINDDVNVYGAANGFGVFGYYTDNNEYEQRSVPNFMYNQQVKWNGSTAWEYNPVVYWPNEYGDKAISDDQDKLTFFAYAPYVKVIPTSGKVANTKSAPDDDTKYQESYGITGMTKNTTQGDPILKYIASFDNKKSVDLCWGVADNGDGAAWNIVQTGYPQTEIKNGLPWIDLERPAGVDQRVRFTFKHATAQMRVSIDADVDVDGHGHGTKVTDKTRIWVREVKFKGFVMKGALNLNNETANEPKWLDYNGQNELVAEDVVIYDGRKDGKEGVAGAVATNEKTLGLNPALIQDGVYAPVTGSDPKKGIYDETKDVVVYGVDANGNQKSSDDWARPGVTNTTVNLFRYNNDDNKSQSTEMTAGEYFHVIPVNDNFEVEIVYDVETVDANLAQSLSDGAAKGSSIENRISKTITFGSDNQLKAGHSYTLKLHLGMNSVKFDAAVSEWIDEAEQDVDLPLNTPVFPAGTPSSDIKIPFLGNYTFALTGLDGGESMDVAAVSSVVMNDDGTGTKDLGTTFISGWNPNKTSSPGMDNWTASKNAANTSGVAIQTLTTYPNDNTIDRTQVVKWTGNQSTKETQMTFVQAAHPLFMKITKMVNDANNGIITLTRYDDESKGSSNHWGSEYGWICDGDGGGLTSATATSTNYIKVERNGAELTWADGLGAKKNFTFSNKSPVTGSTENYENVIKIGEKLQPGDVIKVTIKTGDAPEETVTARYDGMYFSPSVLEIPYRAKDGGAYVDYTLPEVKNYFESIASYTSSKPEFATVNTSSGAITTVAVGETTITATDAATNTATYKLKVTRQKTKLEDNGSTLNYDEVNPVANHLTTDFATFPVEITTFDAKVNGTIDSNVGTVSYYLVSAHRGNSTCRGSFNMTDAGKLETKVAGLAAGNYTIVVRVSGEASATDKYENPETKEVTITFTVN